MIRRSLLALALVAAPVSAQTPPTPNPYDRAIAAGYKALTLCSAIFNARAFGVERTEASVAAHELRGIYPDYDALIATLPATLGKRAVDVGFAPNLPPRVATSLGARGCVLHPIGSDPPRIDEPAIRVNEGRPGAWPRDPAVDVPFARPLRPVVDGALAARYGERTDTTAVLVVRDGRLVGERYAPGFGAHTPQRTWSVAKSLAGTFVGAAAARGLIDPARPAPIPEWRPYPPGGQAAARIDPRAAITVDQLLRMSSGLHSATAGNRTDALYFGGATVDQEATAWSLDAAPGSRFRYANNDVLLAVRALRGVMGEERYANLPAMLFGPLGMAHTIAETDWRGNYILSSQVWSTARDLARFGQLYLQDGVWNGARILPEGWVKYVTTPSGPQPAGDFGYGATFWLMNRSPGVPADTFAAFGNRRQYVVIVPSRQVVIVRRGEDPAGAGFDIARFTADVLAALR